MRRQNRPAIAFAELHTDKHQYREAEYWSLTNWKWTIDLAQLTGIHACQLPMVT